jgi:hypothetical protein
MEPEGLLPHSQEPTNRPYPEPDRSSSCPYIPLLKDRFYYYTPIYAWILQVIPSLSFPIKTL